VNGFYAKKSSLTMFHTKTGKRSSLHINSTPVTWVPIVRQHSTAPR